MCVSTIELDRISDNPESENPATSIPDRSGAGFRNWLIFLGSDQIRICFFLLNIRSGADQDFNFFNKSADRSGLGF